MNVIISNKYQSMLQGLDIETIKTMNGQFSIDEIIDTFKTVFFNRMILDITAIKDYKNIDNLQKLVISIDADKIILLLDDDPESSSPAFQSKLISMGIYNFTQTVEGINYLYNHPNSYRDVAHIQQLDANGYGTQMATNPAVKTEIQRETVYLERQGARVIGIKNITKQSGATTLLYIMLNQLQKHYDVVGVELDKKDFMYFPNNKKLFSKNANELGNFINQNMDKDAILVDLNDAKNVESLCSDIIYLVEPSIIKLNKYMLLNPKGLTPYKGKKIVINQSLLNQKDILDFEYESRSKVFFNMPPLDEREKNIYIVNVFLSKLGFELQEDKEEEKKKKRLFG